MQNKGHNLPHYVLSHLISKINIMMSSGTDQHTYYSQVDAKVFIREVQRLDYSGLPESASARPNIIPTLCLRHLTQLMQHPHQTHS